MVKLKTGRQRFRERRDAWIVYDKQLQDMEAEEAGKRAAIAAIRHCLKTKESFWNGKWVDGIKLKEFLDGLERGLDV